MKLLEVCLPPDQEQQKIVDFLDWVDRGMNSFIRTKKGMIDLLNEQKQAIIHQAVTRGLDPDVPMKTTGLGWMPEIPQHWEIKRAKQVSSIFVPSRDKPPLNLSDGLPWITLEDIKLPSVSHSMAGYRVSSSDAAYAKTRPVPANSVITSCVGNFGVASVNSSPVIINQQLQA